MLPPEVDSHAARTWHYPSNSPNPPYCHAVIEAALGTDSLVLATDASEKVFISAIVMHNFRRWFPSGQIIYLSTFSPTLSSEFQQATEQAEIDPSLVRDLTRTTSSLSREALWHTHRVLLCTPKMLLGGILAENLEISQLVLLIIDGVTAGRSLEQCEEILALVRARISPGSCRTIAFSSPRHGHDWGAGVAPAQSLSLLRSLHLADIVGPDGRHLFCNKDAPAVLSDWTLPGDRAAAIGSAPLPLPCIRRSFKFWGREAVSSRIATAMVEDEGPQHAQSDGHSRTLIQYLRLLEKLDGLGTAARQPTGQAGPSLGGTELKGLLSELCRVTSSRCAWRSPVDRFAAFDRIFAASLPKLSVEPGEISDEFFLDPATPFIMEDCNFEECPDLFLTLSDPEILLLK